jgi:organic radical activating enzyme
MKEKYFGFLGNIYSDYDLPTEWVLCPWKSCGCGADVILSKSKTNKHKELLQVTNYSWEGKERTLKDITDKITEPVAVEMNFSIPYQILWDIGRRCNYDCHYCWPAVHNRTDSHKDYNLIINTIDNLVTNWANDDKIRWNFGGGEPTLHPRFLDILKHLSNKNQWVMVTTNGTRDHKYWKEAAQYINSVNFSAHFDGLISDKEENRFVKNIETVCEHFNIHNDDHWAEVKIMSPPKYIDRAIKLKEKINGMGLLNKIGANNRINGYVSLVPIRSLGNSGELVEYTPEQLEIFKHQ